jgi:hypothetical protein
VRFLLSVVVGGVMIALVYWNELDAVPWPIQLGLKAFVAFAVGFVVLRRGWLAALAAFVIGHALWVAVELRPSMPWAGSDVWDWTQWEIFLITLLPTALGAAVLGALGAWVRRLQAPRSYVGIR